MANVIGIIGDAFSFYSGKWRELIAPFTAIFLISIAFGLVSFGVSMVSQIACKTTTDPYIQIAVCDMPQIMQNGLQMIAGFISLIVIMAALKPLWESINGKQVSGWTAHLGNQLINAIKVIILRFVLTFIALLPLIAFVALNIAAIVALIAVFKTSGPTAAITVLGGMALMFVAIGATMILLMVINFLLTFLEIEMVVGGKGLFAALQASYSMVLANFAGAFLFNLVWWLIGIAVAFITMALVCTCCLAPLSFVLEPLVVLPVMWVSKLLLWREFGGKGPTARVF